MKTDTGQEAVRKMSVFEQLRAGLEDSIAYSKGELSLKTMEMPAPPPKASARAVARIRKRLRTR